MRASVVDSTQEQNTPWLSRELYRDRPELRGADTRDFPGENTHIADGFGVTHPGFGARRERLAFELR